MNKLDVVVEVHPCQATLITPEMLQKGTHIRRLITYLGVPDYQNKYRTKKLDYQETLLERITHVC